MTVLHIDNSMAIEYRGLENLGITKIDLHNILLKEKRSKLKEYAMLEYFHKTSKDNQFFFLIHGIDEEGYLKDDMWVDACSRVAWEDFGDFVCFDATYLTNEYELPFTNFIWIGHHGQSILLGCALLSHVDTETYQWLSQTWLSCMGKPPKGILTD